MQAYVRPVVSRLGVMVAQEQLAPITDDEIEISHEEVCAQMDELFTRVAYEAEEWWSYFQPVEDWEAENAYWDAENAAIDAAWEKAQRPSGGYMRRARRAAREEWERECAELI